MRLSHIRITSFRGIGDLSLDLSELTLLIGENGCSKGAVIDAITLCLSPTSAEAPVFVATDHPRRGGGKPQVRLTFVETKADEFDAIAGGIPNEARIRDDEGRRTFTLSVRAEGKPCDDGMTPARIRFIAADKLIACDAQEAWRHVRRMCPALMVGRAAPTAPLMRPAQGAGRRRKSGDDDFDELIALFDRIHKAGGGITDEEASHAKDLFKRFAARLSERASPRPPSRAMEELVEMVRPSAAWWESGEGDAHLHAMGAVTLVGMLLTALGPRALAADATPLVVAHCPEGWLHPILASRVWSTLRAMASQVVAVTYSGDLVSHVPLRSLRRLAHVGDELRVFAVGPRDLTLDEMRRVTYHIRLNRGPQLFARCWLLVEGETEAWLLPELATKAGYSLPAEGVACIEFAQSGLDAVIRLADILGIHWHLLCDGDRAGDSYTMSAKRRLARRSAQRHITRLREPDVEHCFWHGGYAQVFRDLADVRTGGAGKEKVSEVIRRALKATGKPMMALHVLEAVLAADSPGVPDQLRQVIEQAVDFARTGGTRFETSRRGRAR